MHVLQARSQQQLMCQDKYPHGKQGGSPGIQSALLQKLLATNVTNAEPTCCRLSSSVILQTLQ